MRSPRADSQGRGRCWSRREPAARISRGDHPAGRRHGRHRPRPLGNASPDVARKAVLEVAVATSGLPRTDNLVTETVLAQLRSVVVDLLQITGLDVDEAIAALPRERPASEPMRDRPPVQRPDGDGPVGRPDRLSPWLISMSLCSVPDPRLRGGDPRGPAGQEGCGRGEAVLGRRLPQRRLHPQQGTPAQRGDRPHHHAREEDLRDRGRRDDVLRHDPFAQPWRRRRERQGRALPDEEEQDRGGRRLGHDHQRDVHRRRPQRRLLAHHHL